MDPLPAHLLSVRELERAHIEHIFAVADRLLAQTNESAKPETILSGRTVALLFFEDSTRTRISFELAAKRLSAQVIAISSSASSVQKGETLLDTVRNILAMHVHAIVLRHSASGAPHFIARHVPVPVINAGDGTNEHPTQALLDAYTLRRRWGTLEGKKILIVGDIRHSRVARSNVHCLQRLGAHVMLAGPPTLLPSFFERWHVRVTYDVREALRWCDAVMTLRMQLERHQTKFVPSLREYASHYAVTADKLLGAQKEVLFMHPGPINRGVEISDELADGSQSLILEQVTHGLAIRMAILSLWCR